MTFTAAGGPAASAELAPVADDFSAFIVESGTPGMNVTPVPVLRNHWTTELELDDCEIPVENLVGSEGEGFKLAQRWMVRGRLIECIAQSLERFQDPGANCRIEPAFV